LLAENNQFIAFDLTITLGLIFPHYRYVSGLPTIFHIFAHTIPVEERSRAFGYLVALGSVGQTIAAVVSFPSKEKSVISIFD
jgi:hypothetical protein